MGHWLLVRSARCGHWQNKWTTWWSPHSDSQVQRLEKQFEMELNIALPKKSSLAVLLSMMMIQLVTGGPVHWPWPKFKGLSRFAYEHIIRSFISISKWSKTHLKYNDFWRRSEER